MLGQAPAQIIPFLPSEVMERSAGSHKATQNASIAHGQNGAKRNSKAKATVRNAIMKEDNLGLPKGLETSCGSLVVHFRFAMWEKFGLEIPVCAILDRFLRHSSPLTPGRETVNLLRSPELCVKGLEQE
ncbi:predicted protein [Histoplasma mississippiense (nom. inval.)]|uniref:predicted protein n=1 Tax=Ajellomyces capsulatus (strain NAm1 / WU24) TaxID=2059318 RepID=UPI000157CC4D|nr:predicted protein [Histoplasma mississippiense (nom. inval.)]EDN09890.1 predicted protein [Histoplasma mississippiense (nom. inval.)]